MMTTRPQSRLHEWRAWESQLRASIIRRVGSRFGAESDHAARTELIALDNLRLALLSAEDAVCALLDLKLPPPARVAHPAGLSSIGRVGRSIDD